MMATWTQSYKNRLPDSAFLVVEPGGRLDASGRTVPRSLRHLPVYDLAGRLSLSHVRSVLGSYGQRAKIPARAKAKAMVLARALLHGGGSGQARPAPTRSNPHARIHAPRLKTCSHCGEDILGRMATLHEPGKPDKHFHSEHARHRGKRAHVTHHRRAA